MHNVLFFTHTFTLFFLHVSFPCATSWGSYFATAFDVHGSVHRKRIFKYNQQDATLHKLLISVKWSTWFRRFLRLSSGAQTLYIQHRVLCQTFSATYHCRASDGTQSLPRQWQVAEKVWQSTRCCIYSFWAREDRRKNLLKHFEHFTKINNLCNVSSCWLYLIIRKCYWNRIEQFYNNIWF